MMSADVETPTTEAIAEALDVDPDTIRDCLERNPTLTLAHLIAFADLDAQEIDADTERELEAWFHGYAWRELVDDRSRSGYLIDCGRPEHNNERLKLLRCPICGTDWCSLWAEQVRDPLARHLNEQHGADDVPY